MTLAAQVTSTGIEVPSYETILAALQDSFWAIYGSDVDLSADTQDGQMISIFARAISDANQLAEAVYNSFSPTFAQGAGLSSVVKINGIARGVATQSTATVSIGGVVGTIINAGIVGDNLNLGTQWALPATVTIPIAGTIDVTATCTEDGATAAGVATLTQILTPTLGWQTVTNAAAAVPGQPVESDAALRTRQAQSVAGSAQAILESIYAAIANLTGVGRLKVYENDSDSTDGDGIPSHSISAVVFGGVAADIAAAIALKKPPGTGTYGSTAVVVTDSHGMSNTINFYALLVTTVSVEVTIHTLTGYVSTTGDAIKAAVAAYLAALDIGEDSYLTRLYTSANLNGDPLGATYVVTLIRQKTSGAFAAADITIAFNEAATSAVANITLLLV